MNLTLHLVTKDLRNLRIPVGLWVLVLAAQVVCSWLLLSARSIDLNWFMAMSLFTSLLMLVGLALVYLTVAMLVLADPLSGSGMFWVTRPISGQRLLAAKLITAGLLFFVLPLVVWLPWWLYCGFGPAAMAESAVRVGCFHALAVLPAFAVASLVDQLGRFLLCSIVLCVGLLTAGLNLISAGMAVSSARWDSLPQPLMLAVALLAVCLAPGVYRQYVNRRTPVNGALCGMGLLLAVGALFLPVKQTYTVRGPDLPAGPVQSEIFAAWLDKAKDESGGEKDVVQIDLKLTGLPPDFVLWDGRGVIELRWPDGTTVHGDDRILRGAWQYIQESASVRQVLSLAPDREHPTNHWDTETRTKHAALRKELSERLARQGENPVGGSGELLKPKLTLALPVSPVIAERLRVDPPACLVTVRLDVRQPEVQGETALFTGATIRSGMRAEIVGMALKADAIQSSLRRLVPMYLSTLTIASPPGRSERLAFFRVSRLHGALDHLGWRGETALLPVAAEVSALPFTLNPPILWRGDRWVEDPEWRESSRLVAVIFRRIGGLDQVVRTDRLEVQAKEASD